jgi:hypothetical protein
MPKRKAQKALHPVGDADFHLQLAQAVVDFVNGSKSAKAAFSWVPDAQRLQAAHCGLDPQKIHFDSNWQSVNQQELRIRFITCAGSQWGSALPKQLSIDHIKATPEVMKQIREAASDTVTQGRWGRFMQDEWRTHNLESVQTVVFWKMEDGKIREYAIPRLDTVERCVFYVAGLAMLDKYGSGRAIKRCPFRSTDDQSSIHFFIDHPVTKREFCTDQHAAAHRQRVKRARDARRHK